jgi:hypothetical protein
MAAQWELILHHTYTGTPGVVFDLSPGRGSHGTAINLPDSDFLSDGASPGSGSVDFQSGGRISVRPTKGWDRLGAVRGEVVCAFESRDVISTVLDGGSFYLYLRSGHLGCRFSSAPAQTIDVNTHNDPVDPTYSSADFPVGRWVNLRFFHDGLSTAEVSLDGRPVARVTEPLWPVNKSTAVTIGDFNNPTPGDPTGMVGRIDTVRIWRLNPDRVDQEFVERPIDDDVKACWAQWSREMGEALRSDPYCAKRLRDLLARALQSLSHDALNGGDDIRAKVVTAAEKYRQLWRSGELTDIVAVIADLVSYLQLAGLDPGQNPDVVALLDDACIGSLLETAPRPDCDPDFMALIADLASTIDRRNRNRFLDSTSKAE